MVFKTSKQFLRNMLVGNTFWMVREHQGKGMVSVDGPYTLVGLRSVPEPANHTKETKKVMFKDHLDREEEWYIDSLHSYRCYSRCATATSQEEARAYYDKEKSRELTSRRIKRRIAEQQERMKEQQEEQDELRHKYMKQEGYL